MSGLLVDNVTDDEREEFARRCTRPAKRIRVTADAERWRVFVEYAGQGTRHGSVFGSCSSLGADPTAHRAEMLRRSALALGAWFNRKKAKL